MVTSDLKPKTHADSAGCPCRSETILVIFLIEHILDGAVNPQRHFLFLESECVTCRQIAFPVAFETVNIGLKVEIIRVEDRREICARREKVEIDPKPLEPLRCHKRELMIGNAERFQNPGELP